MAYAVALVVTNTPWGDGPAGLLSHAASANARRMHGPVPNSRCAMMVSRDGYFTLNRFPPGEKGRLTGRA